MSPPLQILLMGCAVVIIAAKGFWLKPNGRTRAAEVRASSELYIQSQTPSHVKMAILEAFPGAAGPYDSHQSIKALQQIALNYQI